MIRNKCLNKTMVLNQFTSHRLFLQYIILKLNVFDAYIYT